MGSGLSACSTSPPQRSLHIIHNPNSNIQRNSKWVSTYRRNETPESLLLLTGYVSKCEWFSAISSSAGAGWTAGCVSVLYLFSPLLPSAQPGCNGSPWPRPDMSPCREKATISQPVSAAGGWKWRSFVDIVKFSETSFESKRLKRHKDTSSVTFCHEFKSGTSLCFNSSVLKD